jgi:hypothetical protein
MNKLFLSTVISLILFPFSLFAQISYGGMPYAVKNKLDPPKIESINNKELYFIDSAYSKDCSALEFAHILSFESSLGDEYWTVNKLANGDKLYRLGIESSAALNIGLYFKNVYIPEGAEVFFYEPEMNYFYGSYNHTNNTESGFFSSELIVGDKIVVEYYEPKSVSGKGSLELFEVLHAYRSSFFRANKDFGDSGECEVNVNCSEGWGKAQQKDAVVRLLIKSGNAGIWCTGTLINNTSLDKTPYVLTADHCGKFSSEEDLLLWRIYFDYQSSGCANPEIEPERKTVVGCTKVAASSNTEELGSDFFLIRLIDEIPIEYLPYFIGWNRDGSGSSQGFTIHHPQGDIKKISLFTDPLEGANYSDGINRGFWKVSWSQTANGHGVTEPGSSGSPIFDDEGYLIGTLSGGAASCSALTAPDYYGKFSVHWEDNGLAIDQQLAPWLDPENTGLSKLEGIYLGIDEFKTDQKKGFTLVPNPAKNNIRIQLKIQSRDVKVDLFSISGQKLRTYYFVDSSNINISNLSKGIYLVKLTSESQTYVNKLIVE